MTQPKQLTTVTRDLLIKAIDKYPPGTGITELTKQVTMSKRWLYRFRDGEIEPLTCNTQELYEVLTGKHLIA